MNKRIWNLISFTWIVTCMIMGYATMETGYVIATGTIIITWFFGHMYFIEKKHSLQLRELTCDLINTLEKAGKTIMVVSLKKAIEHEDYERAEEIKKDLDRLNELKIKNQIL